MPLDTGSAPHTLRLVDPLDTTRAEPAPGDYPTVGAYLKAVRERRMRSLPDLAAATRIRRSYLAAIEDGSHAALPSRPFAIGYVRAYANALELDGEAAAERYKREAPDLSEPLRAPIGVKHEHRERRPLILVLIGVVVLAVVGWNVAQRTTSVEKETPPPPLPANVVADEAKVPDGPISLGAPTPPPAEQTTPVPYVTPGLAPKAADGAPAPTPAAAPASSAPNLPQTFETRSPVYGAAAGPPAVVLQARKAASLIIRGPGGEVYFARQLAAGEAYRAPIGQKLSAEVTNPSAFSLYIGNQLRGSLLVPQTALDKVAAEIAAHTPVVE